MALSSLTPENLRKLMQTSGLNPADYLRTITEMRPDMRGPFADKWTSYEKLKMRLGLGAGDTFGADYLHIFEGPNLTFVFIVRGDKAVILEDDPFLFPSDKLVGLYRLFEE